MLQKFYQNQTAFVNAFSFAALVEFNSKRKSVRRNDADFCFKAGNINKELSI